MSDHIKKLISDSIKNTSGKEDKKRNKKNKLSVGDLNLYGGATRVISIDDFKHYDKMKWRIHIDIFQWTNRDIALYISEKYYKHYNQRWDASVLAVARHTDRIKQALFNMLGFCDNVVVKDYVDYFFRFWSDIYVYGPKKILRFKSLLSPDAVHEFVEGYNYAERIKFYTKGKDADYKGSLPKIDINKVNLSYKLGLDNLILDYGIIIAASFLLKHGKSMDLAIKLVSDSVVRICKNSDPSIIAQITNAYSPYSSRMLPEENKIIDAIKLKLGKKINFNISFLENLNRWKYFEHERNDEK